MTELNWTELKWLYNIQLKTSSGDTLSAPSDAYVRSFLYLLYTLIKLYYTKALSDQASSLAPAWILSSGGQESLHLCMIQQQLFIWVSSGILQDKVKMLKALVLCYLSKHVFCCALLKLWCACVDKWHALCKTSEDPCSAVPQWSHRAYDKNLLGVYTNLPMPRGTQCLLQEPTRNGQSVWTKLSFLGQTFQCLWPFHNSLKIKSTKLIFDCVDHNKL